MSNLISKRWRGKVSPHRLAAYPTEFAQFVITEGKICLQFKDTVVKLRRANNLELTTVIDGDGNRYELLSLGCVLPVLIQIQHQLITAYEEYMRQFGDESLIDHIEEFATKLNEILKR
jgi:hypothetical protein